MARLASQRKMGFYPTPEKTLEYICKWFKLLNSKKPYQLLDPCCGEGEALSFIIKYFNSSNYWWTSFSWGIELDIERAFKAKENINQVIQGSIFNAKIEPEETFGLLWLNPPYDFADNREREEMLFLKHSMKWLCNEGVLVFIVPELILKNENYRAWIASHFKDCHIFRIAEDEYPMFKQVVLIGKKRNSVEFSAVLPAPPYPYIDKVKKLSIYEIPSTEKPFVFKTEPVVNDKDIDRLREEVKNQIENLLKEQRLKKTLSPLFPLRKGHLVSLITAGFLNGKVQKSEGGFILMRGYSERQESVRYEDDKEITTSTYRVGIRVIDPDSLRWYDIT